MKSKSVLIVGAGPTGLTLAVILKKYGIPFRLIEKKEGLSRYTKATNVMQRNQEVLYALGLIEPLAAISGFMKRMMVTAYGKNFGPRTMRLRESPFQDVILCGQHNFESVVASGLKALGGEIEFKTELMSLTQSSNEVTAEIKKDGTVTQASFDLVVGCDGHAGVSRKFTKNDFKIEKTGVTLRQVDCKLKWKRLTTGEQMWLFYFDKGFSVIVPLPGGIHRVITVEPNDRVPQREPTLDEMQTKLREVACDESVTLTEPEWFSFTDLSMGIAPSLIDGRIIFAGDVGNPILPNGGQGMNTGISDAFNLGWKIATFFGKGKHSEILATYNEERHALRANLQKAQFNSLKYTTLVTPHWMQRLFRTLAEPLLDWGGEYKMAQAFSELAINTRKSRLTLDDKSSKRGVRAGDRALDADIVYEGKARNIYEFIYRGSWTLLLFTGRYEGRSVQLPKFDIGDLPTFIVSTRSDVKPEASTFYDLDEVAHRAYGVQNGAIYLIRPDGHVGLKTDLDNAKALKNYLSKWVCAELAYH